VRTVDAGQAGSTALARKAAKAVGALKERRLPITSAAAPGGPLRTLDRDQDAAGKS
jgi:hypothetical protein